MTTASPFAKPPALVVGVDQPNLYRITLAAMIAEWWLIVGAWIAAGLAVALVGFPAIALVTSLIGICCDMAFQHVLRRRWVVSDTTDPQTGLRGLTPIVFVRFGLGVIGPTAAAVMSPGADTVALVLLMQAWSACVAITQFTAAPRLFYAAVAGPVIAIFVALIPQLSGQTAPALIVAQLLLIAMLVIIGRQTGDVWRNWAGSVERHVETLKALEVQRDLALQAERAAEAASHAKSVFLATMSHEIRTPLNGILGMAQVMELHRLDPDQQERVAVLRESGRALMTTLNNVLDLSRIESGRLETLIAPAEPREIARTACAAFAASAELKGIDLYHEVSERAEGMFLTDCQRVRQILFNLVGNAVKFTDRGRVAVKVDWNGAGLIFAVRDTGPGIAAADQARVFEPFEQIDAGSTREQEGSGLGLAICREMARVIGGSVRLESVVGAGATFTLCVPADRVTNDAEAPIKPEPRAALPTGQVLVAEDNRTNQIVIETILRHLGMNVSVVGNGSEAVAAWREQAWSLVLMDVNMPVMDGLTATREIRRIERLDARAATPILGLTGNALDHQLAECRAAGMDDVVIKPIEMTRLVEAMTAVLSDSIVETRREIG